MKNFEEISKEFVTIKVLIDSLTNLTNEINKLVDLYNARFDKIIVVLIELRDEIDALKNEKK